MTDNQNDGRLKECLTTVRTLEEENRQLRQSADSFGQLAERLNKELARERRSVDTDRRRESRGGSINVATGWSADVAGYLSLLRARSIPVPSGRATGSSRGTPVVWGTLSHATPNCAPLSGLR
jgi:hypothetical protein